MTMKKASSDYRLRAKRRERIRCPEITEWMRMVETGKIVACAEQHQLVAHVRRVFATEELIIDYDRIEGYHNYEKYFPFDLDPWEWFAFTLFMCVFKKNGRPRWPQMFLYGGRGIGKTGFMGFTEFCALTKVNGIRDYDVDVCANSEEQAKMSFSDVYEMMENGGHKPRFQKAFDWNQEQITCKTTSSTFKYRTDNPKSKDGLRSGMVAFDEVHAYTHYKNIKVFTTGLGKVPHPRRLYCTSDGDVRGAVLDRYKERSLAILAGEKPDNGFLPIMFRLDSPEEVHDERMWAKPNPRVLKSDDLLEEIRDEYEDFLEDPVSNTDFMTKRMNCPQGNPDTEVAKWEDILATNREVPDLAGMPCVCGIDFAKTTDFISAVLLFRVDDLYYAIHHSWLCARSKDLPRIKAPVEEWVARGILTMVDDVEVHPDLVTDWIFEQGYRYQICQVAIDNYRHGFFMRELESIGYSAKDKAVKLLRPSDLMLVHTKINSAFVNHQMVWGDDPMLRWCTNNTCLVAAQHGNYTFGKIEPKSRKTDAFMALAASFCIADQIPEQVDEDISDPIMF